MLSLWMKNLVGWVENSSDDVSLDINCVVQSGLNQEDMSSWPCLQQSMGMQAEWISNHTSQYMLQAKCSGLVDNMFGHGHIYVLSIFSCKTSETSRMQNHFLGIFTFINALTIIGTQAQSPVSRASVCAVRWVMYPKYVSKSKLRQHLRFTHN